MFQKYYDTNLMTTFVKNLVNSTYIPNVPIWRPDTRIIKDQIYITQNYILKAINNYTPKNYGEGPRTDLDGNYFDIIDKYIDNTPNYGYCSRYTSPNSYYDSKTHYYLGQYLRMQRDMYNLDLMAYYNCWCGEYSDKIRIKEKQLIKNNTISDGLKTLIVPIKYNQKYTIYINSNSPINLGMICMNNNETLSNDLISNSFKQITSINFSNPYVYESVTNSNISNTNTNEKYLKLIIQLSSQVSSNIVILEGDYSKNGLISFGEFGDNTSGVANKLTKIFYKSVTEDNDIDYLQYPDLINNYCRVSPELIRDISDTTFAFDDRLVEYLLLNVINNKNDINNNVKRVQEYLLSNYNTFTNKITDYKVEKITKIEDNKEITKIQPNTHTYPLSKENYKNYLKDTWDNQLRMYLYDLITQHWKTPKTIGISGYVDKDVETIIGDIT